MRGYDALFRHGLSKLSAEKAHHLTLTGLKNLQRIPGALQAVQSFYGPAAPELATTVFGRTIPSPVGMAAGFDKDAQVIDALGAFGFGFVEVGTITGQPQPGNPSPRLFRLPQDQAIVNRMGFNNSGAQRAARALALRAQRGTSGPMLGINIGKTKVVPADKAVVDYTASTSLLAPYADYLVVNVSSPNTPGLRDLQAVEALRPLLAAVQDEAVRSAGRAVPVLVKIAPDLSDEDICAVAALTQELGLAGVVATNTTISRQGLVSHPDEIAACGAGGLSGPVLRARSLAVLQLLRAQLGPEPVLISVGGISTAADAWERFCAGATLVQGYTALIYSGPRWPTKIGHGLAEQLRRSGCAHVSEAHKKA